MDSTKNHAFNCFETSTTTWALKDLPQKNWPYLKSLKLSNRLLLWKWNIKVLGDSSSLTDDSLMPCQEAERMTRRINGLKRLDEKIFVTATGSSYVSFKELFSFTRMDALLSGPLGSWEMEAMRGQKEPRDGRYLGPEDREPKETPKKTLLTMRWERSF